MSSPRPRADDEDDEDDGHMDTQIEEVMSSHYEDEVGYMDTQIEDLHTMDHADHADHADPVDTPDHGMDPADHVDTPESIAAVPTVVPISPPIDFSTLRYFEGYADTNDDGQLHPDLDDV